MKTTEFTAAEVSWVTGLSVKAVNKAIEDAAVPVLALDACAVAMFPMQAWFAYNSTLKV